MNSQIVPYSGDSRQPRRFDFNGLDIDIRLDSEGNPWFDGPDICSAVGIANASTAYKRLDADEKRPLSQIEGTPTQNGVDRVYVSESGMYSLILRSDKPAAKAFKKWVTSEVLPAIRKTGSYSMKALSPAEMILVQAQQLVAHERQLTELREQTAQNALAIEDIHEELLDRDYHTVLQFCQRQHIAHTPALRQLWGKEAKALSRARGVEVKAADEGQYSVGRYHVNILIDVCRPKPRTNGQLLLPTGVK